MGTQPFKQKKRQKLQEQVIELYKAGLTFREVSKKLKISHETARQMWLSTTIQDNTGQELTKAVG